jgi:Cd2+/Zn2+-exporting ATPase
MKNESNCPCCEENDEEFSPAKLVVSLVFFLLAIFTEKIFAQKIPLPAEIFRGLSLAFYCVSYLLSGFGVLKEAVENLLKGRCFNEEFLMALATVGAICIGEYSEAVAVMLLFETGEFLEEKASEKTKKSISTLMDIRPDSARAVRDGKEILLPPEQVKIGEKILVRPGERIPLDGKIVLGKTMVNTVALTGESVPREVSEGDSVLSGFVNESGVIEIIVEKEFGESTVARIIEMAESAQEKKAHAEKFITRFAKIYTPLVCIFAVAVAVLPPVIFGGGFKTWIYRALEILVVSCPCALVISVPLSFFSGIGLASRNGILIKGSAYIESLSKTGVAVFDKTGTLTKGVFEVTSVIPAENSVSKDELAAIVTHAEFHSSHPISKSLKKFHQCEKCGQISVEAAEEISGHGIKCILDGIEILAGNEKLMRRENVSGFAPQENSGAGTVVYVARNKKFLGEIVISDVPKENSAAAVKKLHDLGVKKVVMLTGDNERTAKSVAAQLSLDEFHAELLPQDKVLRMEEIIASNKKNQGEKSVIFTGDGINDSPVLARSDVGISMGNLGSDAAIEASDVVIMDDNLEKIPLAIKICRKTLRNVKENISFSLSVKILVLILCASGVANMWAAVFSDVGVCMLAILNSLRLFRVKKI